MLSTYLDATLVLDEDISNADVVVYLGKDYKNLTDPNAPTTTVAVSNSPTTTATTTAKTTTAVDPAAECKA